jgi:hypothetical protein
LDSLRAARRRPRPLRPPQAFFVGTLISAIADLLLISIIGLHDEKEGARKEEFRGAYAATTTTAAAAPPPAAAPTARGAEAEGYHAGRPGEAGSPPQVTSRAPPV